MTAKKSLRVAKNCLEAVTDGSGWAVQFSGNGHNRFMHRDGYGSVNTLRDALIVQLAKELEGWEIFEGGQK